MNVLFQGYSALRGEKGAPQSGSDTVHKLCDRVQHSTLLEDRRAAVMGLKGLSKDWKLEVGTKGMPVLIKVLREDRADVDILKATIETLNVLCALDSAQGEKEDPNDLGVMFTEIYTKEPSNVTLLLDVLEEVDFYVRFTTVQLLGTLLQNTGHRLQECILTSPMGVSRLIDLLDDRREIIRNEGLLLLIGLSQNNAEIQKIIAFENAFERLLAIILEEGATDGGIIVQDCLQLTHNLLKHNVSNQNLFRETSCMHRIPSLLKDRTLLPGQSSAVEVPLTHESIQWVEQKITNAVLVLELVRILAAPKNPSAAINQAVLNSGQIVAAVLDLAFSDRVPTTVKSQALYALGDSIRGNKANQDLLSKTVIPPVTKKGPPRPCVLQLIQYALSAGDFAHRAAAAYVFESLVFDNPDAQLSVIATLTPPPADNPNEANGERPESPGSLLVSSILDVDAARKDPYLVWFAATMLSHVLHDNQQCQQWALATRLDEYEGEEPISLLHKCMYALLTAHTDTSSDPRIAIGILSLLCVWIYECPEAVKEFLTEGSNIQFLVAQIHQSSVNPLIQGISAFLLGLLHEYNDDSEAEFTRANLQALITSRIGADVFVSKLERLRESKELSSASYHIFKKDTPVGPYGVPPVYFDYLFAEFFRRNFEHISRSAMRPNKPGSPKRRPNVAEEQAVAGYKVTIAENEKELVILRQRVPELEKQLSEQNSAFTQQINQLRNTIQELQASLNEQQDKFTEMEAEQEDLLVCLADQDTLVQHYRERLASYGETVNEEELAAAGTSATDAELTQGSESSAPHDVANGPPSSPERAQQSFQYSEQTSLGSMPVSQMPRKLSSNYSPQHDIPPTQPSPAYNQPPPQHSQYYPSTSPSVVSSAHSTSVPPPERADGGAYDTFL
ncbi:p115 like vesicle tethering protein [Phlyctochytrium arcticum]|nr:p115 like vesicle tethering protein [Phlyctochytrium arcticum]